MSRSLLPAGVFFLLVGSLASCAGGTKKATGSADVVKTTAGQTVELPPPFATKSVRNFIPVVEWPEGRMPQAPAGFKVSRFADMLDNPRWIYTAPNGDVFVAEATTESKGVKAKVGSSLVGRNKAEDITKSPNRITLLRDADKDGVPEIKQVFLTGLNQPFGMLIHGGFFYVGNTDGILRYPYTAGQMQMTATGEKILELPAGGYNNHWTRNLLLSRDGKKILVTVGSASNVAEHGLEEEVRRANVLEINPDGTGERVYASGLRNPVGAAYAPGTNTLWVAVNERDALGDDLVPDYMTSVKPGGFYGWPFSYWGNHPDPRMKETPHPEMVAKAIVPDVALGNHTASLGLAFDEAGAMPAPFTGGAFVGQHGSWNRATPSGYKVVFVPFKGGKPAGPPQDFLTGFVAPGSKQEVYGRPVGVHFAPDGSLLVADDVSNIVWRVSRN